MGILEMIIAIGVETLPLIKELIGIVVAYKQGSVDLATAKTKAEAAVAAMLMNVHPAADATAANAQVDAEAAAKFGPKA